jgi:hypothetical protein
MSYGQLEVRASVFYGHILPYLFCIISRYFSLKTVSQPIVRIYGTTTCMLKMHTRKVCQDTKRVVRNCKSKNRQ